MIGKYRIITLCGSTKFKDAFLEQQKRLTLEGNIVISVGLFGHAGDEEVWTPGTKEMLDDMHKRKIDLADGIFVINVGGYIGESTRSEIEYAVEHGKTVEYLEQVKSSESLPLPFTGVRRDPVSLPYIPSFSSKMLAPLNPEKPICDQYILRNLGFSLRNNKRDRLQEAVKVLKNLSSFFRDTL